LAAASSTPVQVHTILHLDDIETTAKYWPHFSHHRASRSIGRM